MMSVKAFSASMAANYYEKDGYYAKSINAKDAWGGKLAKHQGLVGEVDAKVFKAVIETSGSAKCAGYDLTMSAPKSCSIALGSMREISMDMTECHIAAVKKVMDKVESEAIKTRVTKNGKTKSVKTNNCAYATFNHFVNRNNEIDLHTHGVIANMTEYEGKAYAIDGQIFYEKQKMYGQLYRTELARELQVRGYELEMTDSKQGFFELKGFTREEVMSYSSRRKEILEAMEKEGVSGAKAAQLAALKTRKTKKEYEGLEEQLQQIKKEFFANKEIQRGVPLGGFVIPENAHQKVLKSVVEEMEKEDFAFAYKQLHARVMAAGVLVGITDIDAEKLIKESDLVKLGRMKTGREVYYTTKKNLKIEKEIIEKLNKGKGSSFGISCEKSKRLLDGLRKEKNLTPKEEQEITVHHIMTSKDRFIGVQGLAGTGKTYTLNAVREMAEKENIQIRGICYSAVAAAGLEKDSAIKSTTIHSFLNSLEKQSGGNMKTDDEIKNDWDLENVKEPGGKPLWVIDEAGMVDNKTMHYIQTAAEKCGAKVVLVGDYDQLPPVSGGQPMREMIEAGMGTAYLEDIQRQKDIELRSAVIQSVRGDTLVTYEKLENKGDFREVKDKAERQQKCMEEFLKGTKEDQKGRLMLVASNADRHAMNKLIRAERVNRGDIEEGTAFKTVDEKGKEVERKFAVGDKIIFMKNDKQKGISNGQMGEVEKIDYNKITVNSEGKKIEVYLDKYKNIDHAYAVTNYKAQGMTVKEVIVNMDSRQWVLNNRNALYVAISRAKHRAIVFTDNKKKIVEQTKKWAKKICSKDFEHNIQKREKGGRVENNSEYKPEAKKPLTKEQAKEMLKLRPNPEVQKALDAQKSKEQANEQEKQKLQQSKENEKKKEKEGYSMGR